MRTQKSITNDQEVGAMKQLKNKYIMQSSNEYTSSSLSSWIVDDGGTCRSTLFAHQKTKFFELKLIYVQYSFLRYIQRTCPFVHPCFRPNSGPVILHYIFIIEKPPCAVLQRVAFTQYSMITEVPLIITTYQTSSLKVVLIDRQDVHARTYFINRN